MLFIIRTVFYLILAYFVSKLLKVIFEPKTAPVKSNLNQAQPKEAPKAAPKSKPNLGDYIEYEEVKY